MGERVDIWGDDMTRACGATVVSTILIWVGFAVGAMVQSGAVANAQSGSRVFEIRTYTVADGKVSLLSDIFRDHVTKLFTKHGMSSVGYWIPQDEPRSKDTLIYILGHESREAAKRSWDSFRADPDFKSVRDEEERLGVKVTKVESMFVAPTEYSPIK